MKTFLTLTLCLLAVVAHAANPSTKSFRATGGLVVTSNDVTGIITYDGSGISSPTGGVSATTVSNIVLGNGTKIAPGANVTVTTNVTASNIVYTVSSTSPGSGTTNLGVGQTIYLDAAFGNDATAQRTNMARAFQNASNSINAMLSGDTLVVRGGDYSVTPTDSEFTAPLFISNKTDIAIRGEPDSVFQLSALLGDDQFGFFGNMLRLYKCTNVVLDGLTFRGRRTNEFVLQSYAIRLEDCENVTIKNCWIVDWQNQGISDVSVVSINRDVFLLNNVFEDIGGTNHVTLGGDGTAISVSGTNIVMSENLFLRCFRNYETCCNADTRQVTYRNNISYQVKETEIVLIATNQSDIFIENPISIAYPSGAAPSPGGAFPRFMILNQGSNIVVKGGHVEGHFAGISYAHVAGLTLQELTVENTSFYNITNASISSDTAVGNSKLSRAKIRGNRFKNGLVYAMSFHDGNDVTVEDNDFWDFNVTDPTRGYIEVGHPTVATNMTNFSLVNNRFKSTAPSTATAIVLRATSIGAVVWGNDQLNLAALLTDGGTGTKTMPVNKLVAGMLYSDGSRLRSVIAGTGTAFDTNTGILTATGTGGGGGGGTNISIQHNETTISVAATNLNLVDGVNITLTPTNNPAGNVSIGFQLDNPIMFDGDDAQWGLGTWNGGAAVGFTNLSSGLLSLYAPTSAADDWTVAGRFTVGSLPGSGDYVAHVAGLLMKTNAPGGGGAAGATGDVQYKGADGNLDAEAAFNYDEGDDTLTVSNMIAQTFQIYDWIHFITTNTSDIGTFLLPARTNYANQFEAKVGISVGNAASSLGSLTFGTNFTLEGALSTPTASVLRTPTNANSGVMVALPVAGITNQQVAVPLTAGQVLTHNGTTYVASHLTSGRRTNITCWTETFGGTLANWASESYTQAVVNWAIAGGVLNVDTIAASSISGGSYLNFTNWVTAFESWTMTCRVVPVATGATSYGLGFGIRNCGATDPSGRNAHMRLWFSDAQKGYMSFYQGSSNAPQIYAQLYTNQLLSFVAGDALDITMKRRAHVWTLTASNTANGNVAELSAATSTSVSVLTGIDPQAGYFSLWAAGGTQTVDNIVFTVDPIVPVTHLVVGDSIANGLLSAGWNDGYVDDLRKAFGRGVQVSAANGGQLVTVGRSTNEINLIQPERVLMSLGGNDISVASTDSWSANYTNFVGSISNATFWHLYPTPRDAMDMTYFIRWIGTNYPRSRQIDLFSPLKNTNSLDFGLRSDVDAGDGVHPNRAGHSLMFRRAYEKLVE